MSETEIEQKLKDERELRRLNQLKTLGYLGYDIKDKKDLTLEQIEARIELQVEQNKKNTADATTETPTLFKGIDGERANKEAPTNIVRSFEQIGSKYNALTAQIPQLRKNVAKYDETARILRLPASIQLDKNNSFIDRVVL